jgi:cell wall-associated NlpC family hydrolase
LQLRTVSALVCSLVATAASASSAMAANTGGVASTEPTPTPAPAKVHLFPITSHSRSVAYKGPVFQKSATGEVVPYTPSASTSDPTGTAASATGGIAPASSVAGTPEEIPSELTAGDGMTSATGPVKRPELLVPGTTARFVDGIAAAPMSAPAVVQDIIWAGNELIGLPYIYGGGHASFISPGYDCSGTVSYALHGGALLTSPEDSSEFEVWGSHGAGRWVAIFANAGHAYMTVAGLRLDTSPAEDPANLEGPRWRPLRETNSGFVVRHPLGL